MIDKNLLLDANILIALVDKEESYDSIVNTLSDYNRFYINYLSYIFAYEKARKVGQDINSVISLLNNFEILPLTESTRVLALKICQNSDLEDASQLACAIENDITNFVTRDKKLKSKYDNLINIIIL
jgi:predicted nucleic acid-binding protein